MKSIIHPASSRGGGDYGWLKTKYSFSFADWHDASRMGFGALRVLNDDHIEAGKGFDPHSHKDMEIVTIVTKGAVAHKDSSGGAGTVSVGEVQAMSAGSGVTHAEYNASKTEDLDLFQLWFLPKTPGGLPRYATKSFEGIATTAGVTLLVGPDGTKDALTINQDAYLSYVSVTVDEPVTYTLNDTEHGVYVFVIEGDVDVSGETLSTRDAIGIIEVSEITLTAKSQRVTALIIEVPVD